MLFRSKGSMLLGSKFPKGVFEMEMSYFKPHLVSYFPGDESASRSVTLGSR